MRDYFISYASEDRQAATLLADALESLGGSCFIDHRDIPPGHPRYRDRLIEGISDCECIVVVLTGHAQASDEVYREVQAAHNRGRRRIAVWLDDRGSYINGTLELLLDSSQDVVWGRETAETVAQHIRATATVSSLRAHLADYQSVVEKLHVDLSEVFVRVERDDYAGAVVHTHHIGVAILRSLWHRYGLGDRAPDEMRDLIAGCRDHFEHQSLLDGFVALDNSARRTGFRAPSMDGAIQTLEHLMAILSVLRAQRWELHELAPKLRADAAFLSGLLIEAGWLQGSELVPSGDVVYMVFERPRGDSKLYLEIVLGDNEQAIAEISRQSDGRIFPATDAVVSTRFLVVAQEGRRGEQELAPQEFLTPEQFVLKFTGLRPLPDESDGADTNDMLVRDIEKCLQAGTGNVLVYGAPGVGKSHALRTLCARGWPGAPPIRFFVDYAAIDLRHAEDALDTQLANRFPAEVRHRTRPLVSYLVRSGRAALILDSIECATVFDQPVRVARTFARLCAFLSNESTVIMGGRDAALRDSSTVREFFMKSSAVSDVLAHTLRSTGVDVARLPRMTMVRARRRQRVSASTPRDRLLEVLSTGIWDVDEDKAASQLAEAIPAEQVTSGTAVTGLSRDDVVSLALGGSSEQSSSLDISDTPVEAVGGHRSMRELRAAIDYVRTALGGNDIQRWSEVSVGEATRRLIRLLSLLVEADGRRSACLSLVGPPNYVVAVPVRERLRLSSTAVTVGEFREFLRALPTLPSLDQLTPGLPDESQLHPMYERLPKGFYRDGLHVDHPAVGVSWWAADSFARWSGTRLPTSLEWEIAGRGWDGRIFPWGDNPVRTWVNCADRSAGKPILDYSTWRDAMRAGDIVPCAGRPSDPASRNRSPQGELDMSGNIWEWVATDLGDHRVIAGGSYDNPIRACVLSSRSVAPPTTRSNAVGFRVVRK